jgi:hypothetical protein
LETRDWEIKRPHAKGAKEEKDAKKKAPFGVLCALGVLGVSFF